MLQNFNCKPHFAFDKFIYVQAQRKLIITCYLVLSLFNHLNCVKFNRVDQ